MKITLKEKLQILVIVLTLTTCVFAETAKRILPKGRAIIGICPSQPTGVAAAKAFPVDWSGIQGTGCFYFKNNEELTNMIEEFKKAEFSVYDLRPNAMTFPKSEGGFTNGFSVYNMTALAEYYDIENALKISRFLYLLVQGSEVIEENESITLNLKETTWHFNNKLNVEFIKKAKSSLLEKFDINWKQVGNN